MEPGSTHDDSPYPRYREASTTVWWALAIAVVLASAASGYYYYHREKAAEPPAPLAPSSQSTPQPGAEPAIRNPLALAPGDPAKPLPTLDNSDAMMRDALVGLMGRQMRRHAVGPQLQVVSTR